jgi:hypothetical protein
LALATAVLVDALLYGCGVGCDGPRRRS